MRHVKGRRVRKFAPVATLLAKELPTTGKGSTFTFVPVAGGSL